MERILAILIGYALGTFQTGYFMGKIFGIDIREHGSKNAGMTNVNRTLGSVPAAFVFVIDILKAVAAFVIASIIFDGGSPLGGDLFFISNYVTPGLWAGIGAVLGHNFPFFMRFKGGKGISCTLGVLLMVNWQGAVIAYVIGFFAVLIFRYISLASLLITFFAPILFFIFENDIEVVVLTALLGALAWFMHRDNIKRLITKTERKFAFGKKTI